MVEKQCILTEHKELGSGGLAAPADSLTLACHKGESGMGGGGGVSGVGLPATKWEEMALSAQQCTSTAQSPQAEATEEKPKRWMNIIIITIIITIGERDSSVVRAPDS